MYNNNIMPSTRVCRVRQNESWLNAKIFHSILKTWRKAHRPIQPQEAKQLFHRSLYTVQFRGLRRRTVYDQNGIRPQSPYNATHPCRPRWTPTRSTASRTTTISLRLNNRVSGRSLTYHLRPAIGQRIISYLPSAYSIQQRSPYLPIKNRNLYFNLLFFFFCFNGWLTYAY